jgi:hypothetical protein
MDQRDDERKPGPRGPKMVQHRRRPDNNRRDRRRRLDDHRRGRGADWRAGKPISTESATHRFADRHAHQPNAGPADSPGFSERPDRKPDRTGPAAASHPAGDVKRSDLHPHLHTELSRAELSGADHRVELGRVVDHLVQDAWRCG